MLAKQNEKALNIWLIQSFSDMSGSGQREGEKLDLMNVTRMKMVQYDRKLEYFSCIKDKPTLTASVTEILIPNT